MMLSKHSYHKSEGWVYLYIKINLLF